MTLQRGWCIFCGGPLWRPHDGCSLMRNVDGHWLGCRLCWLVRLPSAAIRDYDRCFREDGMAGVRVDHGDKHPWLSHERSDASRINRGEANSTEGTPATSFWLPRHAGVRFGVWRNGVGSDFRDPMPEGLLP